MHWNHDFDLSGSRDVVDRVTIRFSIGHFLLGVIVTEPLSPAVFEILCPKHIGVNIRESNDHVTFPGHSRDHSIPYRPFPVGGQL